MRVRLWRSRPRWRRLRGGGLEARLVWIFGSPRTGSTWLLNLLRQDQRVIGLEEPTIGVHVGALVTEITGLRPQSAAPDLLRLIDARGELPSYFFSTAYESAWRPAVRQLVLRRLGAEVAEVARRRSIRDPVVAIKEPDGSQGADVLMSSLPAARMIFLLRDGRDVIDSELDSTRAGGWAAQLLPGYTTSDEHRLDFISDRAHAWLARTSAVQRAYESHQPQLRWMLHYETLLSETEHTLARLADWLRLDRDRVVTGARKLSFRGIDPAQRGPGRFVRAATPGLWRQNLSSDEQSLVASIIGPKLREVGYK